MSSPMMRPADYSPALPHERIEEIFPDIFLVYGSARVGPATRLNRNMAIVRSKDELSLINPDRIVTVNRARHTYFAMRRHCRFLPPSYFYSRQRSFRRAPSCLRTMAGF